MSDDTVLIEYRGEEPVCVMTDNIGELKKGDTFRVPADRAESFTARADMVAVDGDPGREAPATPAPAVADPAPAAPAVRPAPDAPAAPVPALAPAPAAKPAPAAPAA